MVSNVMRSNPVKRKLARGETVVGTMMMEFATPGIGRLAAAAGAEFGVFDMEHSGWTIEIIKQLMASCRGGEFVPLVRPAAVQYHDIARVLDMGAMGVVMPFIDEPQQAEFVVRCCRYPPHGRRGAAFAIAHDDYRGGDVREKMASANEELMIVVQIESVRGLDQVEEIARVPGVDAVWIGQFDLTASMGIPGNVQHPDFRDAQARILRACQQAGVAAGYGSLLLDDVVAARDQGFRFLVYTADLWIYQRALRAGVQTIRGSDA
jgi:2-dehydro-3-deoxyglucarate aldolase/4-hydroxy-2-oxoheptanedioate aldolase